MPVDDARIQSLFANLLARAGITQPVLLCADVPLEQRNFAETVRRYDGQVVVAISRALSAFDDEEISGMLTHELGHLLAGAVGRSRPPSVEGYLREEHEADAQAARLVGREAVCAAVRRAFQTSVVLGFASENDLRRYMDIRLTWIVASDRGTASRNGAGHPGEDSVRAARSKCQR